MSSARAHHVRETSSHEEVHSAIELLMQEHADVRGAACRRAARVPFAASRELRLSAGASTELERLLHRAMAQSILRLESARRREAAVRSVAARGGNVAQNSNLHTITAVRPPDGSPIEDTASMGDSLLLHFSTKWCCTDSAAKERVNTLLNTLGQEGPEWSHEDRIDTVSQLRRAARVDETGICAHALQLYAVARPSSVLHVVRELALGGGAFAGCHVRGVALGKKSATPTVQKVRILFPLTVWMTVLDCLLAKAVHTACDVLPPLPQFWECGVAGSF